ncbi:MAG TPA: hypothetical protein VN281_01750 [Verrucomicrobiae bacterium]|nr:hypothetical protein [Verrucomicrobiae bacterium]
MATIAVMAAILFIAKSWRTRKAERELASSPPGRYVTFYITDKILPMERGKKYNEPLTKALSVRHIGRVTGGGTQMDRNGGIAWIELELLLYEPTFAESLDLAAKVLLELGAPRDSKLAYQDGENRINRFLVQATKS